MKLVDYKNREISIGDRVRIQDNIPSVNCMLHKDQIVKISEIRNKKIRVTDSLGKVWWVEPNQVSSSFL